MTRTRRTTSRVAFLCCCLALLIAPSAAAAPTDTARPHLRLVAASGSVDLTRFPGRPVPLDVGVYVASLNAPFEIHATRPAYPSPIQVRQMLPGGASRELPEWTADGWSGLSNFIRIQVTDDSGDVAARTHLTFCPDGADVERIDTSGPMRSPYPGFCPTNVFTRGSVWGIAKGWATRVAGRYGGAPTYLDVPDGSYTATFSISRPFRKLFDVSPEDGRAVVQLHITSATRHAPVRSQTSAVSEAPSPHVPTMTHPDPSVLPELIPLPAYHISTVRVGARDYVDFAATVWNSGPSQLSVEGYRRQGTDVMDAYQYFYDGGKPVGRAPVGTFEYDSRPGHEHWHFRQFARYTLLDASKQDVVVSDKEAFCLTPTEPIDLLRRGANWDPEHVGFGSACGDASSVWTRETLDAGWGDTYIQTLPGQSFDITGLPNGTYYIEVRTNPAGRLYERDATNDVVLRRIKLGGTPGDRTVRVPAWHGIDSEGSSPS
ncbi:MAG: lysyl oxidase family protein [Actinomycetota bacterium]